MGDRPLKLASLRKDCIDLPNIINLSWPNYIAPLACFLSSGHDTHCAHIAATSSDKDPQNTLVCLDELM